MTDYQEKYRAALREGDEEKATEYYEKYKGGEEESEPVKEEETEEQVSEIKDPSDMTVSEAKDYVGDDADLAQSVLEAEKEGKDRTTLVEYLEERVE